MHLLVEHVEPLQLDLEPCVFGDRSRYQEERVGAATSLLLNANCRRRVFDLTTKRGIITGVKQVGLFQTDNVSLVPRTGYFVRTSWFI